MSFTIQNIFSCSLLLLEVIWRVLLSVNEGDKIAESEKEVKNEDKCDSKLDGYTTRWDDSRMLQGLYFSSRCAHQVSTVFITNAS